MGWRGAFVLEGGVIFSNGCWIYFSEAVVWVNCFSGLEIWGLEFEVVGVGFAVILLRHES